MMGRSHAASGVLAGELVVLPFSPGVRELLLLAGARSVLPVWPAPVALMAIAVCGGAALLPDLDHLSSTVSRSLGPVTRSLARVLDWASLEIYHATAGPRDKGDRESGHRLVTHTPVGAVTFGLLVTAAVVTHPVAAAVTLGLLVCLLANGFRVAGVVLVLAAGAGAWWVTTTYPGWWWLWGLMVAVGAHIHREGDWCTVQGVPRRSWPRMVDGRRWDMDAAPGAFRTGGPEETSWVRPGLYVGVVLVAVVVVGLAPDAAGVIGAAVDAVQELR